jgi:AbgT putative transporter family
MTRLLFLFLLIAQFIAYFDFSNMAQVAAVWLGDILEQLDLGGLWLLLGVMIVTIVVTFVIVPIIPKWAILAPIFVPLMLRLGVEPQTVLAAYRVGDSPTNVLTPLMPYLPLMVVFAERYQRDAGIGTVIALMIPYTLVLTVPGRCSSSRGTRSASRSGRAGRSAEVRRMTMPARAASVSRGPAGRGGLPARCDPASRPAEGRWRCCGWRGRRRSRARRAPRRPSIRGRWIRPTRPCSP